MDEKDEKPALAVVVNADGVEARVSEGTLAKLGPAVEWLFPRRAAKVKITSALAESVAEKIRSGTPLGSQEQYFVSLIFEKEARALANRQAAADRVVEVLPEVEAQTKALPEHKDRGTSIDFVARAESIASDLNDVSLRELFARVLAGEISRPGAYSMKTLELIRTLDSDVARLFDRFRQFVFDSDFAFREDGHELLAKRGFRYADCLELQDAGLIAIDDAAFTLDDTKAWTWTYGRRQLRACIEKKGAAEYFSITRLTRAGREIASVLPPIQDDVYFLEVGAYLANEMKDEGSVTWRHDEAAGEWHTIAPTPLEPANKPLQPTGG